jgi:hypothetical protein
VRAIVRLRFDSKKGRSEMQMDVGATNKERTTEKKVPAKGKEAEKPSVWRRDSTMKDTRRPAAPTYKLTIPVEEDLDVFHKWWMEAWDHRIISMEQESKDPLRFSIFFFLVEREELGTKLASRHPCLNST